MDEIEVRHAKIRACIKQHPEFGKNAIAKHLHYSAAWVRHAIDAHPEWGYACARQKTPPQYTKDQLEKFRELAREHKGEWTQAMYAKACGMTRGQVQGAIHAGKVPEYVAAKTAPQTEKRKTDKRKRPSKQKAQTITYVAWAAKQAGMSYGKYVHEMRERMVREGV